MADPTRLELATSAVTGQRSKPTELRIHQPVLYIIFPELQPLLSFGLEYDIITLIWL